MKTVLVTGGAGFIGVNAADRWARKGWKVVVLDDLSRRGTDRNLAWLQSRAQVEFHRTDVRDWAGVDAVVAACRPDAVLHLAAQVAVTTSIVDPRTDIEINAMGTFNVLDALRRLSPESFFLYASTNKVYGRMESVGVEERNGRYELRDLPNGVGETQPLDFHSPYGCSKGAADQYTLDFHKSYGLRTVTFRQSCIYGQRQFGVEDQGWVAWFLIASVLGKPLTIYGDGKQIRDLLHIDDLVDLYEAALERPDACTGRAYNIGGGPGNTLSLNELVAWLEADLGRPLHTKRGEWRTGDQPVFVADITKARTDLGWAPRVAVRQGFERLLAWVKENREMLAEMHAGHG
jgi:CDP-paratose 2-epimerase